MITKFCFSHKHESYFSVTPTNSSVAYFFKSAKSIALFACQFLAVRKIPTHHQKFTNGENATQKSDYCPQCVDATIKLVTIFKRRCLLLACVTATSTVAIMVAAARVDVGSCSLTHYARNDDDCRRGVGGERGSMGLVKFWTALVGRVRRRRCSRRRP